MVWDLRFVPQKLRLEWHGRFHSSFAMPGLQSAFCLAVSSAKTWSLGLKSFTKTGLQKY